jgi:serine/threonine protein kinase
MQTEEGVAMGTPGYMSPEQVRGLPATYRSGIFSFGLVLQKPSRPRALMTENADDIVEDVCKIDDAGGIHRDSTRRCR